MNFKIRTIFIIIITIFLNGFLITGCSLEDADIVRAPIPEDRVLQRERERRERAGTSEDDSLLGDIFKDLTGKNDKSSGGGIGVNTFLWKATLDTLSFMPLVSADPFGGVIITDWHSNTETSKEKFKIVAYILGTELRVDGIKIAVFKKIKNVDGNWVDKKSNKILQNKVEDAILTKARKYKIQSTE
jgi:hypothetical protein